MLEELTAIKANRQTEAAANLKLYNAISAAVNDGQFGCKVIISDTPYRTELIKKLQDKGFHVSLDADSVMVGICWA